MALETETISDRACAALLRFVCVTMFVACFALKVKAEGADVPVVVTNFSDELTIACNQLKGTLDFLLANPYDPDQCPTRTYLGEQAQALDGRIARFDEVIQNVAPWITPEHSCSIARAEGTQTRRALANFIEHCDTLRGQAENATSTGGSLTAAAMDLSAPFADSIYSQTLTMHSTGRDAATFLIDQAAVVAVEARRIYQNPDPITHHESQRRQFWWESVVSLFIAPARASARVDSAFPTKNVYITRLLALVEIYVTQARHFDALSAGASKTNVQVQNGNAQVVDETPILHERLSMAAMTTKYPRLASVTSTVGQLAPDYDVNFENHTVRGPGLGTRSSQTIIREQQSLQLTQSEQDYLNSIQQKVRTRLSGFFERLETRGVSVIDPAGSTAPAPRVPATPVTEAPIAIQKATANENTIFTKTSNQVDQITNSLEASHQKHLAQGFNTKLIGITVQLAGEPIGVAGDNMFDMIGRSYQRYLRNNTVNP